MNQKGQASTIVWFVSIIVIFNVSLFLLIGLFFPHLSLTGFSKPSQSLQIIGSSTQVPVSIQQNLQQFLNQQITVSGKKMTMYYYIASAKSVDLFFTSSFFKSQTNNFFLQVFPTKNIWAGSMSPWAIRIDSAKYVSPNQGLSADYAAGNEEFCLSPRSLSDYYYLNYIVGNKVVTLCVFKSYYAQLESSRYA